MSGSAEERLREIFLAPGLASLVRRLRRRLEAGRTLTGTLSLPTTPEERRAIERLLGRTPGRGRRVTVSLDELERILQSAQLAPDLATAVVVATGPLPDRGAQLREAAAWDDLHARLRDGAAERAGEVGHRWAEGIRAAGLLRRVSGGNRAVAEGLVSRALALAEHLPAESVALAELAGDIAGDAHALDPGTPLATLGVRLAAGLAGVSEWNNAEARREAWAGAGVLCDELSAPALVLNLHAGDGTVTERMLATAADAGEPCRITLRQLVRHPLSFSATEVFVCENPTIVARAADFLGPRAPTLVCTDGQLATPVRVLLRQLAAAGCALRYHGDFDWPGIAIANTVIARFGAKPWLMSARDYESAPAGPQLEGVEVAASWDPDLAPIMRQRGVAVHEEQVLPRMLAEFAIHS